MPPQRNNINASLTNSKGHTVEVTMIHSCGYVPFQVTPSAAAPFTEGGGTSSDSGPNPPVAPDVEHEAVPAPPPIEQPVERRGVRGYRSVRDFTLVGPQLTPVCL